MAELQNPVKNENRPRASWREGATDSLPIVIGYLPVAFAFGLNASRPGFTPTEASVSSSSLTDIFAIFANPCGFRLAEYYLQFFAQHCFFNAVERPGLWSDLETTDDGSINVSESPSAEKWNYFINHHCYYTSCN